MNTLYGWPFAPLDRITPDGEGGPGGGGGGFPG